MLGLPLHLLEAGVGERWGRRNLRCAGYLLDLLLLGEGGCVAERRVMLTAGLVVVGAVNCCQTSMLGDGGYVLVKFAKGFLRKCYRAGEEELGRLEAVVRGVVRKKMWERMALVPAREEEQCAEL